MVELSLTFEKKDGDFFLTENAVKRLKELIELEGREGQALNIKVTPGGCAGFMYDMAWVPDTTSGKKIEKDGAILIIKDADMRLLAGSTLDYVSNLMGSKFEVINPNATSSCGCGKSFS